MTESLKGWLDKIPRTYDPAPEDYRSDERLLTAFIREVERHYQNSGTFGSVMGAEAAKGRAFAKSVRDFGLDGDKP